MITWQPFRNAGRQDQKRRGANRSLVIQPRERPNQLVSRGSKVLLAMRVDDELRDRAAKMSIEMDYTIKKGSTNTSGSSIVVRAALLPLGFVVRNDAGGRPGHLVAGQVLRSNRQLIHPT